MEQPIAETEGRSFDGGCHCGAIRFRVQGPLRQILMCHCSDCLKISGTSWGASAARAENLDWLTEARPRWYRSSDWAERGFCSECGSQMFYRMDDRPLISIRDAECCRTDISQLAPRLGPCRRRDRRSGQRVRALSALV